MNSVDANLRLWIYLMKSNLLGIRMEPHEYISNLIPSRIVQRPCHTRTYILYIQTRTVLVFQSYGDKTKDFLYVGDDDNHPGVYDHHTGEKMVDYFTCHYPRNSLIFFF